MFLVFSIDSKNCLPKGSMDISIAASVAEFCLAQLHAAPTRTQHLSRFQTGDCLASATSPYLSNGYKGRLAHGGIENANVPKYTEVYQIIPKDVRKKNKRYTIHTKWLPKTRQNWQHTLVEPLCGRQKVCWIIWTFSGCHFAHIVSICYVFVCASL